MTVIRMIEENTFPREEHGFPRTKCACEHCRIPCRHVPGGLDPADLNRLCPQEQDVFAWAETHLRALTHRPYPILVPARQGNGHCHWLMNGQCLVHENAPYGCAIFDSHMTGADVDRRYSASVAARKEDAQAAGLYYRVWQHLCALGLTGLPGRKSAVIEEARLIQKLRV